MYITASLPPRYGAFNRIKEDNYPFQKAFMGFLEAVTRIGMELDLDMDQLAGAILDRAFEGRRVPDIPDAGPGMGPVTFRFRTKGSSTLERYFNASALTNKAVVSQAVRLALRLSAEYGTSLPRLSCLLGRLFPEGGVDNVDNIVDKPAKEPDKTQAHAPVGPRMPAGPHREPPGPVTEPQAAEPAPGQEEPLDGPGNAPGGHMQPQPAFSERLDALVGKANQLIRKDTAASDMPVVETNPLLNDFL